MPSSLEQTNAKASPNSQILLVISMSHSMVSTKGSRANKKLLNMSGLTRHIITKKIFNKLKSIKFYRKRSSLEINIKGTIYSDRHLVKRDQKYGM
jgi:hypothetical protein